MFNVIVDLYTSDGVDGHPRQGRPIRGSGGDDVTSESHPPRVWRHSVGHVTRVHGTQQWLGSDVCCGVDDQWAIRRHQVNTLTPAGAAVRRCYWLTAATWPSHVHTGTRVAGHVTRKLSDHWRQQTGICWLACNACRNWQETALCRR